MQRTTSRSLLKLAHLLGTPGHRGSGKKAKRIARPQLLDVLEKRCVPATLYVGLPADFSITRDVAPTGLSANDTVKWKGAGSDSDGVSGLTFGVNAFSSVKSAVAAAPAGSTLVFAADTYTDGAVTVNSDNLIFNIPANAGGFSLTAGTATTLTFTGSGSSSVPVTGNASGNTFIGNASNNVFNGGTGDNVYRVGTGNAVITGGAGVDTVQFGEDFGNYRVQVTGGVVKVKTGGSDDGNSQGDDGSGGTYTLAGVEVLQFKDKSVRVTPSADGFTVGSATKPVASGLCFGNSFVSSKASGDKIQVNIAIDGKTTSGWFTTMRRDSVGK